MRLREEGSMSEPSEMALQEMARRLLGRDLDAADGAVLRSRLRNMARVKALLAEREAQLGETAPMTVTPVPMPGVEGDGAG